MMRPWPGRIPALWLALALVAIACATDRPATARSTPANTSPGPAWSPTPLPTATTQATPTDAPTATAGGLTCPVLPQAGLLPSDRLVDLSISSTTTHDLVTFVFAPQGSPTPAGAPRGSLDAAQPPFSYAGSGQEIGLLGEHAVRLRFTGMTIATESGEATYQGPADVKPRLPALREAIQFDASEGVVGWYVGYDGPGCVTLSRSGDEVTVAIAHQEAPAG